MQIISVYHMKDNWATNIVFIDTEILAFFKIGKNFWPLACSREIKKCHAGVDKKINGKWKKLSFMTNDNYLFIYPSS